MIFPAHNPELADSILAILAQVCKDNKIPYFISGGTLLGFYRDGTYIPSDPDIDVSILRDGGHFPILPTLLYPYGITTDGYGKHEGRHYWKENMLLDIIWVEQGEFYKSSGTIEHQGISHPTPYPIESYLEWKYGDTWRTPLKQGEYTLQHEH